MSESVDCVVIGAGVVGLAVARELAQSGLETIVLESESHIGTGTSSRNSEVIHAGIYYAPGSLKALLCVAGKKWLYQYCAERGIDHSSCGKLIVATCEAQMPALLRIRETAAQNSVTDLRLLTRDESRALEPQLECVAALISPSTGIVDSHALMLSLQGDLESAGGTVALASPVLGGACMDGGIELNVGGESPMQLRARYVVNGAGLLAQSIAHKISGLNPESIPPIYYAKGNYYSLNRRSPFQRLIYPVPQSAGLGVHLTLDLSLCARFGPDVEWVESVDYTVDPHRADAFYSEIRKYWPGLPDGSLSPAYAGIRPKLSPPGAAADDFLIQGPPEHRVIGLVNLYGIESPGLTASLAIARYVKELLLGASICVAART
jgi:L-2-hydroxyglutarate oxidase LhgO